MRRLVTLTLAATSLSACVSAPAPTSTAPPRPVITAPPPQDAVRAAPSTGAFRAPKVMNLPIVSMRWKGVSMAGAVPCCMSQT